MPLEKFCVETRGLWRDEAVAERERQIDTQTKRQRDREKEGRGGVELSH